MAKDDMEVIMYKILKYLYECMKEGVTPRMEDMCYSCKLFSLPERYWLHVVSEMMLNGFIRGFIKIPTKSGAIIQMTDEPGITLKGREYLRDNSGMKEAAKITGKAFEILLESVVKALLV